MKTSNQPSLVDETIYPVSVTLELTRYQVMLLNTMAIKHYDYTCNQLAKPRGLVYGFLNLLAWAEENGEDHFTTQPLTVRDVDLLAKVIEPVTNVSQDQFDLYLKLCAVGKYMNDEYIRLNTSNG